MAEPDAAWLASRGWDMGRPADVCHLDCSAPGFLKTMTDASGRAWEIILCPEDAMVLEAGEADGDYSGALTPADSRAGAWPWMLAAAAS